MDYVLVKYRGYNEGRLGWYQMDRLDAINLFNNVKLDCVWFCVVTAYEVYYYNRTYGWSKGLHLLKYV